MDPQGNRNSFGKKEKKKRVAKNHLLRFVSGRPAPALLFPLSLFIHKRGTQQPDGSIHSTYPTNWTQTAGQDGGVGEAWDLPDNCAPWFCSVLSS